MKPWSDVSVSVIEVIESDTASMAEQWSWVKPEPTAKFTTPADLKKCQTLFIV